MTYMQKGNGVSYSVGPAPDGDGALLKFSMPNGMVSTITLPAGHVNQLIALLRAVVLDESTN